MGINADRETVESWDTYLREFFEKAYPVFQAHGISRETALLAWVLNLQKNILVGMAESMIDGDEDWKQDGK